jgi:hypothetical protein
MSGAIPPLPWCAFMAWCSVKRSTGTTLPSPLLPFCHKPRVSNISLHSLSICILTYSTTFKIVLINIRDKTSVTISWKIYNSHGRNLEICFTYDVAIFYSEGRLQSSWTHLITPSRNFVEVRWRSLLRSTFLGKRCTSYNTPSTFRKRAADRWSLRNFLPRSALFMVGKARKSHGARSELNSVFGVDKVDR